MTLFKQGDFMLHSGARTGFLIDCADLTGDDWRTIAAWMAPRLQPFGWVEGVPRGGLCLAQALQRYATDGPLLIADDVWTTGGSMHDHARGRPWVGAVVFARGSVPDTVLAMFALHPSLRYEP